MSKKYKGKLCVYCGEKPSTGGDHVFAREFFLPKHRTGLPQVPACDTCNGEKSELEHYLTTVLPFGGLHPGARDNLVTMVPKRLQKNTKLRARLLQGYTGDKIPLESGRIEGLFALIAKGLLWHHWQAILRHDDQAAATVIHDAGLAFLDQHLFNMNPRDRVQADLGEGTFAYEGLQSTDCPHLTIWQFSMYGGLRFGGDARASDDVGARVFVATGPKTLLSDLWKSLFGEDP